MFHVHTFFAPFSTMRVESFHDDGQHLATEPTYRTFWPSLFTLAASHVNHSDVYLSIHLFQVYLLSRDDA
jgi:hypothetical protein